MEDSDTYVKKKALKYLTNILFPTDPNENGHALKKEIISNDCEATEKTLNDFFQRPDIRNSDDTLIIESSYESSSEDDFVLRMSSSESGNKKIIIKIFAIYFVV